MNVTRISRIMGMLFVACAVGCAGGCGGDGTTEGETEGKAGGSAAKTAKPKEVVKAEDLAKAFADDKGIQYFGQTLTIQGVVQKAEMSIINEPNLKLQGAGDLVVECHFKEDVMKKVAAEIETYKAGNAVKVRGTVTMKMENSILVADCVIVD